MATSSARLLRLLSLLQARRAWPGPELAAQLEVSTRTLRRDVDVLRELGYPVHAVKGPDGGYRLGAGSALPPLIFDGDQAVAAAVALQSAPVTSLGLADGTARALAALRQAMPAPLRAEVDALRLTAIRNWWELSAPPIDPDLLRAVGDAVRRRHLLRVDELRPDGSRPDPHDPDFAPPRRLEPHHLALWAGRWYVVAFDPDQDRWLVRRIDGLHARAPTGIGFSPRDLPGGDVAAYVVAEPDRGERAADWPCVGTVVMELPAAVVARWAPAGSVVAAAGPGRTSFTLGAWSWAGVAGLLATFGADFAVQGPEALRDACAELAARCHRASR